MVTSKCYSHVWKSFGVSQKHIFQSILFPVDFSSACETTAPYVRDLAEFTGGKVTLLYVLPWHSAWCGAADLYSDIDGVETVRKLRAVHMASLAAFRDKYFNGVRCQTRLEFGSVAGQIIDYAEHTGADLIMMPVPGKASDGRPFIGSVVSAVLRDAPCPVWTSTQTDRLKPFTGFRSIVCPLAPDSILNSSIPAYVNETAALGAAFGSKLIFVSAAARSDFGEDPRILPLEEEYSGACFEQLMPGTRWPVCVETGPLGHVVRHVVQMEKADVVVINRGHEQEPFAKLGTHAYEIVVESPCPVLTLCMKAIGTSIDTAEEKFALAACV